MRHHRLGELRVSAVSFGCFTYGKVEEEETLSLLDLALGLGVTMLDTSDTYGAGESERLVGKAVRERHEGIVVATKGGQIRLPGDPKPRGVCGRPDYLVRACEASLQRLGLEAIDLYYLHRVDPEVPVEDTVGAMADLVRVGKVRYLGLSEVGPEAIRRAHAVHPITAVQNEFSLLSRETEDAIPLLRQLGIGLVAYSPLGRGLLTASLDLAPDDVRKQFPRFSDDHLEPNLALVERFKRLAVRSELTPSQLALAWVLAHGDDVVAIPGTRSRARLDENLRSASVQVGREVLEELELMFAPGVASGARR